MEQEQGCHLLCIAPTGSGKSFIYETLAAKPGARTLILSPLRALIRQQIEKLQALGVPLQPALDRPGAWVCTPEELDWRVRSGFRADPGTLVVVDECHCIPEWGPGFRPLFARIPGWVRQWQVRRSLWLTATLPRGAGARLASELGSPLARVGGFGLHPGLRFESHQIPIWHRPGFLVVWLEHNPGPGILFSGSRAGAEDLGRLLAAHPRFRSDPGAVGVYHAGLTREERLSVEERTRAGRLHWLAATSAFGMGMDFPQFEWVMLYEPPPGLVTLVQMLGRAGRSQAARPRAALLWDEAELQRLENFDPVQAAQLGGLVRSGQCPARWLGQHFI